MQWNRRRVAGALLAAVLLASAPTVASAATGSGTTAGCSTYRVPVSRSPGTPDDQLVYAELCLPADAQPHTVQLLVHGVTYDHNYWDFPGFSGHYSYVDAARKAGYATLNIDRLGSGKSSHPPAALLGMNSDAWVSHQLIRALREGGIGGAQFSKIIEVGHSYGSGAVWVEASRYHDVDAVIATGADHFFRYDTASQAIIPSLIPAAADPKWLGKQLDPGYLTTRRGTRYADFMAPGHVESAVVAEEERLKQTLTATEAAQIPLAIGARLHIRVPTLVAMGDHDPLFCGAGVTCASERQLVKVEKPKLGHPPCVDAYLQPGAGHDNALVRNAQDFFSALNAWSTATLAPDGTRARGCPEFDADRYKKTDPGPRSHYPTDLIQGVASAAPGSGTVLNGAGRAAAALLNGAPSDLGLAATP